MPAARGPLERAAGFTELVSELARPGWGVIMKLGKCGVGKTTLAATIAVGLAKRGHRVHLTTTDPAAHVDASVGIPSQTFG